MEPDNDSNFNMTVNRQILKPNWVFFESQLCDSDIVFSIDITKRMGLCNTIDFKCRLQQLEILSYHANHQN